MKLLNKVLVVTGAGSGIGREISLTLLSRDASVAGVDLAPGSLEGTASLAPPHADCFAPFVADVSSRSAVEALPAQVLTRFGAIDGIVNNAGIIQPFERLAKLDYSTIERVLNVNLLGTLYMTKSFLPYLIERPEAHIVNVSSMGGFVPVPGQTMYCASKAAVKLLSEGLAGELEGTSVRVSVAFPGAVATNIRGNSGAGSNISEVKNGAGVAMDPAEAASIIVRGVERNLPRIFVGKDAWFMDKLYRLSPAYASGAIARKMRSLLAN